ncbi:RNA polymerase sigma factor [Flavobacterium succinicans]|uniref:RNA polymerase sigma factor n=1 Tax=Flavobacterium succinicans TaxID=29536 RepID=A0A199XVG6_9FLAO|nr:sigma-70 family RNA polymerase sigma factor [Flavobacterium succinicans]OAZ05437.1 RNA polymerase sigma factor [Flavobacterium succinicans]
MVKKQLIYSAILDDSALWNSLKEGNENAFSLLFKRHYPHLIQYGNSFLPFPEKVQDCVQDVFTDIWIYREKLSDNVVVKAYLLASVRKRITRSLERDRIFRFSSSIDTVEFLFDFSIEHHLISDETAASKVLHLNHLINDLPSRQKEALYLRYTQELTVDQIADTLDINYQSANNLLHRALLNLRKEWKENIFVILMLLSSVL